MYAAADADVLIVKTAVAIAQHLDTVVVGDDTDLLIFLCSSSCDTPNRLFLRPEPNQTTAKPGRIWDISLMQQTLGQDVVDTLLFVHAIGRCDTTSRMYGIGKATALKKAISCKSFRQIAYEFYKTNADPKNIIAAGNRL